MNKVYDINGKEVLIDGNVIDIHQTVNGQNLFFILNSKELDIRYWYDTSRKYEYDKKELISPSLLTGDTEVEVICNVFSKENINI